MSVQNSFCELRLDPRLETSRIVRNILQKVNNTAGPSVNTILQRGCNCCADTTGSRQGETMGTMQTMRPIRGEGRRRRGMWGKSDQSTLTETERQCLSHAECHKSFFLSYVIFMTLTLLLLTDFLPCLVSPSFSFSLFSLLSTIPDPGTQPLQVPGSGSEIFPPCQTKTATSVSTSGQGRQPVCRRFILQAVNFLSLHSQHPPRRHSHKKHRQ